ncbi:hypothetical protein Tco_1307081, partial [Tanacetum coccineum]
NGPITLKVYRDDGSNETIPNFKASDLHLSKWREVMQVCPKRTRARWTTIYGQIQTRMENLHKTEQELEIDFNKPITPRLSKNTRRNIMDIITTQWCQQ